MVQEELHKQDAEVIEDDGTLLGSEVWAEVDDTSAEVLRAVEWPGFLKRILWYLDTEEAGVEVKRLDELRFKAANDNHIEKEKAA